MAGPSDDDLARYAMTTLFYCFFFSFLVYAPYALKCKSFSYEVCYSLTSVLFFLAYSRSILSITKPMLWFSFSLSATTSILLKPDEPPTKSPSPFIPEPLLFFCYNIADRPAFLLPSPLLFCFVTICFR